MPELTAEGRRLLEDVAERHGVSPAAAAAVLAALAAGGGTQAQFSHPDLGGMGQWSQGGMVMVGDMFNNALKARVDALCSELAGLLATAAPFAEPRSRQSQSQAGAGVSVFVPGTTAGDWWPNDLGVPASVGAQNDMRYAFFPQTRRLAIAVAGRVSVHDTGEHRIGGFAQAQGGGQTLTFTSQHGVVRVSDLPLVTPASAPSSAPSPASAPTAAPPPPPEPHAPPASGSEDVFAKLERLAALRAKDIITQAEFEAKKAELLARL